MRLLHHPLFRAAYIQMMTEMPPNELFGASGSNRLFCLLRFFRCISVTCETVPFKRSKHDLVPLCGHLNLFVLTARLLKLLVQESTADNMLLLGVVYIWTGKRNASPAGAQLEGNTKIYLCNFQNTLLCLLKNLHQSLIIVKFPILRLSGEPRGGLQGVGCWGKLSPEPKMPSGEENSFSAKFSTLQIMSKYLYTGKS